MMASIKSELRKLLSLRSTYITLLLGFGLAAFISYWVNGYKYNTPVSPDYLQGSLLGGAGFMSVFAGIPFILNLTHEYRYNTIFYTLTMSPSRTRSLLAKIVVATLYAAVFTAALLALVAAATLLGLKIGHHAIPAQSIVWWPLIWKSLLIIWGTVMYGMIIAALVRNQIGAFTLYMMIPGTIEALLGLVLKAKAAYLPFTALGSITAPRPEFTLTVTQYVLVVTAWIIGGWLMAWLLFVRRDAN